MAKPTFCAACGTELTMTMKAIPSKGEVINLVAPHECEEKDWDLEEIEPAPVMEKKDVNTLFDRGFLSQNPFFQFLFCFLDSLNM